MRTTPATAAAALLALGAALALAPPAPAQTTRYFPPDTEVVVTVDFRQILESELLKSNKNAVALAQTMLEGALQQNEEAHKYVKDLGFDPFRDLDSLTTASGATADPTKVLVILHGRFDPRKFAATAEAAARDHADIIKVTRAGKHQLIELTPPGEEKALFLALVGAKTLLASQGKATVTDALKRAASDSPPELKQEVKDLLASRPKKASLSAVATGPAVAKLLAASPDPRVAQAAPVLAALLEKVVGLGGSVTLTKDVEFQLGVATRDAETAKEFAQQAGVGLVLARVAIAQKAQKEPRLAPALDVLKTVRASAEGSTFVIRGRVPAAVIGEALKQGFNRLPESK